MPFQDKVIWITGASSGIGEALAYEFNLQGAKLILSSRRPSELECVKENCKNNSSDIQILPLDLLDTNSHPEIVQRAVSAFGHIDMLINNGGISQRGLAQDTLLDVTRQVMDVNFFGSISLTRELVPYLIDQQSGHIVVISSVMGKFGTRLRSAYAASKHALHGWFDCLRQEVTTKNLTVTLVCPGFIKTNVTYNALQADGTVLNEMGDGQMNGMAPEKFAKKLLPKLEKKKSEIYIGGKEIIAIYLKRFVPALLEKVLLKVKVT